MKNLLRLLHLGGSQEDSADNSKSVGSSSTKHRFSFSESASGGGRFSFSESASGGGSGDSKALSGLSNWITAAKNSINPSSASNQNAGTSRITGGSPKSKKGEGAAITTKAEEDIESICERHVSTPATVNSEQENTASIADAGTRAAMLRLVDTQALSLADVEEYQVQMAMALSVSDDPEASAIETAKQISLGSDPTLSNTPAEVLAFRYWKYNCLNYDDKVTDGFYDVYGVVSDRSSETMPPLVDLQETPVSDQMTWEVVLVNRATDPELVKIEQKALAAAASCEAVTVGLQQSTLIQRIADIVVDHMGGRVVDTDLLLKRWRINSTELRSSLGNIVLPLGCLQVGLARHRALLFKVLADAVGIPCQLVKGKQYSGSDEGSVNIIKIDGSREFIIDLMGAPGTLLPSDVPGPVRVSNDSLEGNKLSTSMTGSLMSQLGKNTLMDERKLGSSVGLTSENDELGKKQLQEVKSVERYQSEPKELKGVENLPVRPAAGRSGHPGLHFRSPSWTEGLGSAGVNMKAKDASQYMIVAAKENPEFAQKLHDVLLESGVQAPADLFTEVSPKELRAQISDDVKFLEEKQKRKVAKGTGVRRKERSSVGPGRPSSPPLSQSSSLDEGGKDRLQRLNSVEGLGERRPLEAAYFNPSPNSSPGSTASSGASAVQSSIAVAPAAAVASLVQENLAPEIIKHVPVAAAAAATAAVVASSMVVAAAKSDMPEPTLEVPVAAAATATAAVVVATTAVAGRRLELYDSFPDAVNEEDAEKASHDGSVERQDEADTGVKSPVDIGHEGQNSGSGDKIAEDERVSDKSTGSMSARSDPVLDDVSEWEIPWEDLVIGERIGLGSYGEVYRGDWHGTEVAVKKFLDQDISGDALEEFRSEVRLMKRMRHPNVVLFMGAVMRPPNLSIVTEFLPRGSLYRLIHRPNNQLDERRRMRMALDVAKGMNYLHNSTPVIVHRDLKSPNLLVDKNWVVKVCDFGLSRMKHNTFLSSKSTAGTPEWMAPEVLRNEPSNEKSDVYSFGVILWELATLQQPWASMNPMQVVGAVGFQHRCLDIPETLDPAVARIIRQCWQSDPNARPSFAEIMAALKPLQRPITASQSVQSPKT